MASTSEIKPSSAASPQVSLNKSHQCTFCPKEFKHQSGLYRHITGKHTILEEGITLVCEICKKIYKLKRNFSIHIEKCQREHKARELLGKSLGKSNDEGGLSKKYTSEKLINCKFCKKIYRTMGCLLAHMKKCHNIEISNVQESVDTGAKKPRLMTGSGDVEETKSDHDDLASEYELMEVEEDTADATIKEHDIRTSNYQESDEELSIVVWQEVSEGTADDNIEDHEISTINHGKSEKELPIDVQQEVHENAADDTIEAHETRPINHEEEVVEEKAADETIEEHAIRPINHEESDKAHRRLLIHIAERVEAIPLILHQHSKALHRIEKNQLAGVSAYASRTRIEALIPVTNLEQLQKLESSLSSDDSLCAEFVNYFNRTIVGIRDHKLAIRILDRAYDTEFFVKIYHWSYRLGKAAFKDTYFVSRVLNSLWSLNAPGVDTRSVFRAAVLNLVDRLRKARKKASAKLLETAVPKKPTEKQAVS